MKRLILFLLLSGFLGFSLLQAQEVISSGGAHATGSGISLSWTVGEPVTATFNSGGYILTQGFHQSRLSSTAINDFPMPGLALSVYPNPTKYTLHLRVDEGDFSQLQYYLMSVDGRMLLKDQIVSNLTGLDMSSFAPGYYLLRIAKRSGEPVKTYKVVRQ